MPIFRRKKTEQAGSFRVFDILRHEMEDGDGQPLRDAFTFACPDWVSVVPVTARGEFVCVRQYRHGIDGPTIEVPGGMIDEGEDPAAAAVRELREETGYGGGELVSLGITHPNPVLQDNRHHMYLVRGAERLGEPAFDVGEFCEVKVFTAEEMHALVREGGITHALVLLSLARAFDRLASPRPLPAARARPSLDEILALLASMEELQARKVIELARRIKPNLTSEDIKNPHDFPELADMDWHFEDGHLAGLQSVVSALRALRERASGGGPR